MYRKTSVSLIVFSIIFCSLLLFSQPSIISWQKIFGAEDLEGGKAEDIPAQILQTKDGGYIITGETQGSDGAEIPSGMYVAKLDKTGIIALD